MEQENKKKNGLARAGLILAIIGLLLCWALPVSYPLLFVGLILSLVAFFKNMKTKLAIAGIAVSMVGLILSFVFDYGEIEIDDIFEGGPSYEFTSVPGETKLVGEVKVIGSYDANSDLGDIIKDSSGVCDINDILSVPGTKLDFKRYKKWSNYRVDIRIRRLLKINGFKVIKDDVTLVLLDSDNQEIKDKDGNAIVFKFSSAYGSDPFNDRFLEHEYAESATLEMEYSTKNKIDYSSIKSFVLRIDMTIKEKEDHNES